MVEDPLDRYEIVLHLSLKVETKIDAVVLLSSTPCVRNVVA